MIPLLKCIYTERQNSCTAFSFDFFSIKNDKFKNINQYSLVFVPVKKTIVTEQIKRVGNHGYIFGSFP